MSEAYSPVEGRTYKRSVEASQARLTPQQIREAKNARCVARRSARRDERAKIAAERKAATPQEQLQRLDWRLGRDVGATRERARLLQRINESEMS